MTSAVVGKSVTVLSPQPPTVGAAVETGHGHAPDAVCDMR
jgi:hypothetical protein